MKRGQAAVEYLMTYGWALLVLGIVMALIYSTGVFSPSYLVSEECNLGPKLPCQFKLHSEGGGSGLDMRLENGFGYTIHISEVTAEIESHQGVLQAVATPDTLKGGESGSLSFVSNAPLDKGSVQVVRLTLKYYSCASEVNPDCTEPDPALKHMISGRIVGKVI